ncbi:MAG: cyclic nucleotide-binding domain-containing protein [Spirochaetes bacterium]|nr:cyclic nucleotide-binding domain-containing protein [Spirochaetota bacterium]MBU1081132.1 cyclic nucleotide-binding domain-containing protein [Spirochaetota bacterium]
MGFFASSAFAAFLFGALSSVSLPIGAIVGIATKPSRTVISAVMSFGAGSLMAAISFELVNPAVEREGAGFAPLALGLLVGCLVFIALSRAADERGAAARTRSTLASSLRSKKRRRAEAILERLGSVDILRSLPPEQVQAIVPFVQLRSFAAGAPVFVQDGIGDSMYIIDSGSVSIEYVDGSGLRSTVAELGPGQTFGEMAIVWNAPRTADAVPLTDTTAFEIKREDFELLCGASPALKEAVAALAAERGRTGMIPAAARSGEEWAREAARHLDETSFRPSETELKTAAVESHASAASAIWLGLLLDGIPESLVIGASMSGFSASPALIAGLFMANLPESLSGATMMKEAGTRTPRVVWMWTSLVLAVGIGALLGNMIAEALSPFAHSLFEGLAAGSMLAMIAQTMLPEAYERNVRTVGLFTVLGFIATVFFHTLG